VGGGTHQKEEGPDFRRVPKGKKDYASGGKETRVKKTAGGSLRPRPEKKTSKTVYNCLGKKGLTYRKKGTQKQRNRAQPGDKGHQRHDRRGKKQGTKKKTVKRWEKDDDTTTGTTGSKGLKRPLHKNWWEIGKKARKRSARKGKKNNSLIQTDRAGKKESGLRTGDLQKGGCLHGEKTIRRATL